MSLKKHRFVVCWQEMRGTPGVGYPLFLGVKHRVPALVIINGKFVNFAHYCESLPRKLFTVI